MDHDDHDRPAVLTLGDRPTDGCPWCCGYFDGFMAGPDGLNPAGNRHDYAPTLLGDPEYLRAAAAGRADRTDLIKQKVSR